MLGRIQLDDIARGLANVFGVGTMAHAADVDAFETL